MWRQALVFTKRLLWIFSFLEMKTAPESASRFLWRRLQFPHRVL